jgi:hypothetical protein
MEINPYQLDWGSIFTDSYNVETKNATLIYNFDFDTSNLYLDYISYSVGHIYWVLLNLPAESSITVIYDLRGMKIIEQTTDKIGQDIRNQLKQFIDKKLLTIIFKR